MLHKHHPAELLRGIALLVPAVCVGMLLLSTASVFAEDSADHLPRIREAFLHRMEAMKNIHVRYEERSNAYYDDNGEIGKLRAEIYPIWLDCWHLGSSNRQDTTFTFPGDVKDSYAATYNASRGIGKTRSSPGGRDMGYINSKRDPLMNEGRYRFWLDIRDWGLGGSEYIFTYALDHWETAEAAPDASDPNIVKLTTDYKAHWKPDKSNGHRTLWLDVRKRYMPVRGHFEMFDDAIPCGRREVFEVIESVEVTRGVWVPTKFREHVKGILDETIHNTYDITVTAIEQGKVTEADLEIEFVSGTKFVDAIQGITFIGDESGNPIGAVEPVLQDLTLAPPTRNSRILSRAITGAIIASVLLVAAYGVRALRGAGFWRTSGR